MGKKAKEHRRRVQARNARIKAEQNAFKKRMNQIMEQQIAQIKESEKNSETETSNDGEPVQPTISF